MPTAIDFNKVRPLFGGKLKQSQVDGIVVTLNAWDRYGNSNVHHLAYLLATKKWETAHTMQPIREFGRGKGRPYGKVDSTGKAPYGRGDVQLTWRDNYVRADRELNLGGRLAADYDLALNPEIAVRVLITGSLEGWFTGKKLGDYSNFKDMRRVINGTDKAAQIAAIADGFLAALTSRAAEPVKETPETEQVEPDVSTPEPKSNWLAALIAIIVNFLKGLRK